MVFVMFDTIRNILKGDQHPLLKSNKREAYVYRQFLQDAPNIIPNYTPIYKVNFQNIEHHPYKIRYYFRLITNDIYNNLNRVFAQQSNDLIIQYQHQEIKQAIEEYIYNFHEKIAQQKQTAALLSAPPSNYTEEQMFAIICYYALASLACAYMQYIDHFKQNLALTNPPTTPQDFIYDTLQIEFPKEILIKDQNLPIEESVTQPQQGGNTFNFNFNKNVGQVIGNADQVNIKQDE